MVATLFPTMICTGPNRDLVLRPLEIIIQVKNIQKTCLETPLLPPGPVGLPYICSRGSKRKAKVCQKPSRDKTSVRSKKGITVAVLATVGVRATYL